MLDRLSAETFHMIVHHVPSPKDRASLSQVSKRMHRRMIPLLYESIIIPVEEERLQDLEIPVLRTYFNADGSRDTVNRFAFVKDLKLVGPARRPQYNKCGEYAEPFWSEGKSSHDAFMDRLGSTLEEAFSYLPRNCLRSFSWHLKCCIPDDVLGASGYIPLNQSSIRTISLMTEGACRAQVDITGLPALTQLRSISWKGYDPDGDPDILFATLVANSGHLESLELEATSWGVMKSDSNPNEFTGDLNSLPSEAVKLSTIRHLSLSRISLESAYERMAAVFQLDQLLSLTLRSCPYTMRFLEFLAASSKTFQLRSFEVLCFERDGGGFEDSDDIEGSPFCAILKRCESLEEVCVSNHYGYPPIPEISPRLRLFRLVREDDQHALPYRPGYEPYADGEYRGSDQEYDSDVEYGSTSSSEYWDDEASDNMLEDDRAGEFTLCIR